MSLIALFVTQDYCFLHGSPSEFRIHIFSFHIKAYLVSFDSLFWTLKSDIVRPRYERFNAQGHACLSFPYVSHNITFFLIAHAQTSRIKIFSADIKAHIVSFDSLLWTRKSDIVRPRYELFNAQGHSCLSLPYVSHNITFFFLALPLIFRIRFFQPISKPTS